MSNLDEGQTPKVQPTVSGQPPRQPKLTARNVEDQRNEPGKTVYLLDPTVVRDLARALNLKSFEVVADLMKIKLLKSPDETIAFETSSFIAQKHGYQARRHPPGVLVV